MSPIVAPSAPLDPKAPAQSQVQHRLREASHQFEAILLARVLKGLERTTHVTRQPLLGGGGQYGSMMVEALSDAIARSGGIGLGATLERGLNANLGKRSG